VSHYCLPGLALNHNLSLLNSQDYCRESKKKKKAGKYGVISTGIILKHRRIYRAGNSCLNFKITCICLHKLPPRTSSFSYLDWVYLGSPPIPPQLCMAFLLIKIHRFTLNPYGGLTSWLFLMALFCNPQHNIQNTYSRILLCF
jgi:hypothetical protein